MNELNEISIGGDGGQIQNPVFGPDSTLIVYADQIVHGIEVNGTLSGNSNAPKAFEISSFTGSIKLLAVSAGTSQTEPHNCIEYLEFEFEGTNYKAGNVLDSSTLVSFSQGLYLSWSNLCSGSWIDRLIFNYI